MSVQKAQSEISSTEFVDWITYLDEQETKHHQKLDYYLANIAAEIRRSYVKEPVKVKMEHFLLKFGKKKKMTKEEATRRAKTFFGLASKYPVRKK